MRQATLDDLELFLRFLQLLCENGNTWFCHYLRVQPDNLRTVNLLHELLECAQFMFEVDDEPTYVRVLIQMLDTITEMCQGCMENQRVAFDLRIIDGINTVLRCRKWVMTMQEDDARLKHSTIVLTKVFLENAQVRSTTALVPSVKVWLCVCVCMCTFLFLVNSNISSVH